MRIGQFTDSFYPIVDGVGRVVYNYANQLCSMGHECYVVTPMANTGYRGGYPFELVDFTSTSMPGSPQYKAGFAILDRHYHQRMESIELDVLHAHTPFFSGMEAMRLMAKRDIPLVGTFHSKYYDDFYKATGNEAIASLGVKFVVDFYSRCDEVWAVSQSSADVLRSYDYDGEIIVIENGTEVRAPKPENARMAAERFAIPEEKPMLLYVGQMDWKKNIRHILEAASLLHKEMDFTLVLAGQGSDAEAIRTTAQALSLGGNTVLTGHISDTALLDGLYNRADLFVFPSVYDTFSLVLREAAAMGTPAVVTRGSSPAEAIKDGKNGYLADNTAEDLARVIRSALGDRDTLHRVGECAQRTIPIPWEQVINTVAERYRALSERAHTEEVRRRHDLLRSGFAELWHELQKQNESLHDLVKRG